MTDTVLPLAVVTGGAGDIGQAISRALALSGFRIVLADLVDMDHGTALAKTIIDTAGNGASYVRCDHTKPGDVETLFAGNEDIALLVAAAGTVVAQPFLSIDLDSWKKQIDVNLTSVYLTCRSVLPQMVDQGAGAIINLASASGIRWTGAAQTAYAAAKAGVIQFSRVVAVEYAARGIRVNTVVPGQLHTPMVETRLAGQRMGGDVEALLASRVRRIPMGWMGDGRDTANAALFLASDEARFITGTELVVDGGMSLRCD